MRILFINLPYRGHVMPTIGLVQELCKRGCSVTYLLPFGWEDAVWESGAQFHGYPDHKQLAEQMKNAWDAAESIVDSFDLVLYEQFFFLGKHLAQKHGKPAVRIFTAPATNQALMTEFIEAKGPMHIFRHKWLIRAFTRDIARGIPLKTDNWLDEIVQNPPGLNLVYTLREFQPYAEDFPKEQFLFLGPSIYPRKEPAFSFEKKRPVVYIALGSVLKGPISFFRNCIEAFRGKDVDVILSVGKNFPSRKLRNIPENVHIYPFVPQLQVLKIADVFVTHGGMNSISEALAAATPMVVIPFVSDQPANARQVERLGVGRALKPEDVTKVSLQDAVFSVLSDGKIRQNLERVQDLIAEAPGNRGGGESILQFYENQKMT